MDTNVRSDMITLDGGGTTSAPLAGQVEIVGRLAAHMPFADMFLRI